MTKLKHILLAGTLVPALILTPLVPAGAQAPDPGEHHGKRQHEGGEHGKRSEAGGGQKGEAREHKGERAEKAERRQGGAAAQDNESGKGAKGNRGAADDSPRGGGKHRQSEGTDSPAKAERAQNKADRAQNREERQERKAGRAGSEDRDTGSRKAERQDSRKGDQDRGTPARADGDQGRKTGERDNNPRGDRDTDRKMGDRNKDRDPDRKMGDRDKDRDPDRKMGDRTKDRDTDRKMGDHDKDRDPDRKMGNRNKDRDTDRKMGDHDKDRDPDRKTGERNRDRDDHGPDRDNARRNDEPGNRRVGQDRDDRRGPGRPASVGFAGGFMAPTTARSLDQLRRDRREVREGDSVFIREPGRTIVQERGRSFIVHDENDRFRALGYDVRRERRGDQFIDTVRRPNGDVILTYTDDSGRLLRRVRRAPGGREVVLIENGVGGRIRPYAEDVVVLPPPPMRIPRDRYIVDYRAATPALVYDTLVAPPLAPPPQRYTLDQIRYSPDVRNYVRQVDINSINFESGSWDVPAAATGNLEALAAGMNKAIARNPDSVFLIEGYTDATGNPNDNLSLSDRRAQSVAEILTKDFKIPPENLTTQGYGQQNPKEDTQGPSAANRRVVVRNITQLMASGEGQPAGQ